MINRAGQSPVDRRHGSDLPSDSNGSAALPGDNNGNEGAGDNAKSVPEPAPAKDANGGAETS